jgi:hypothetical protein
VPLARRLTAALGGVSFWVLAGCGGLTPPKALPVTDDNLALAVAEVGRAVAEPPGLVLSEDGFAVDAWRWEWQERTEFPPTGRISRLDLGLAPEPPRRIRERVLVGPSRLYVPMGQLSAVAVRRWAAGSGVELTLNGVDEPIFVATADEAGAERLGAALDLLRRARRQGREAPAQ